MSSASAVAPRSSLSTANEYTGQIHEVFTQHWNTLESERQAAVDKIDQWRRDEEQLINKYADKQKSHIDKLYNRLRPRFDEIYEDNLETANAYHATQQVDPFKELYEVCQLLKFQLVILKSVEYVTKRPEVTTSEDQVDTNTVQARRINRRRRNDNTNDKKTENASGGSPDSPSDSVISTSKQIDDRQPSGEKSRKKNDQTRSATDDSNNQATKVDESNNKCPICFMIFPLTMTRDDRLRHINEHYTDD